MNFIRRAGIYLVRKKGRTLLMLCLLLFMSLFVLVGISFLKSAQSELDRLRLSMASGFVLEVNTENELYREHISFEKGGGASIYTGPMISREMIEKICSIDGVKDYIVELFGYSLWADLKLRPGMWADTQPIPDDPYITEEALELARHEVGISSCRNGAKQKYFRTGALTIVEGRNIEEEDQYKAVISDWIAKQNRLSVGDTVTLETKEGIYQFSDDPLKTLGEPIKVEIVGVFHANFSQESSPYTAENGLIENYIYTDMDTYYKQRENRQQKNGGGSTPDEYDKVEFLVEDPKELDSIMRQVESREDLDFENMELVVDDMDFMASAKPYSQIRIFAMLLFAVGLGGLGMILFFLMRLWMYGRRHEVAILRSVGMKKREILGQMLAECLFVSAAAIVTALFLSGPVLHQCASMAERAAAPNPDQEKYQVTLSVYHTPEITKTSSDEVILAHTVSKEAALFAILFVCGVSAVSVILSSAHLNGLMPKQAASL